MHRPRMGVGERVMQLSARTRWTIRAVALAGAVACGATPTVVDGVDFAGPSSAGVGAPLPPSSASLPNVSGECPPDAPTDGETCGPSNGTCEYGQNVDPACNTVARCSSKRFVWVVDQGTHCPSTCPAHFDEQAPGASCNGTDVCTYLEATCGCAGAIDGAWTLIGGGSNNVADGGDEAGSDGGDAGASAIGQWRCVRPGNGCPARRPIEGTSCTTPMDCDYGTCVFGVPLSLSCVDGLWTALSVSSCP